LVTLTGTGIDEDLEGFQPAMMSFKSFMQTQVSLSSAPFLKGLFQDFKGLLCLVGTGTFFKIIEDR
jgi:hypothetical protein